MLQLAITEAIRLNGAAISETTTTIALSLARKRRFV
jgi:hypothetical protein